MSTTPDEDTKSTGKGLLLLGGGALVLLPFSSLIAVVMVVVLFLGFFSGTNAQASTACATPGVVVGGSNVDTAMKTLMTKWGLSAPAAAGLVGNWQVEAGPTVDPAAVNELGYRGIAQWDPKPGGRWATAVAFGKAVGADPMQLGTQLRYAAWELGWNNEWAGRTGGYAKVGADLKAAQDPNQAAKIVFDRYEIPGDSSLPKRQAYARGLAQKYASGASSSSGVQNITDVQTVANVTVSPPPTASGGWRSPATASYRFTSRMGPRESPGGIGSTNHQGVDMVMPPGSEIVAASDGVAKIAQAGYFGLGTAVILDHGAGVATTYGHMARLDPALKPGAQVKAGQRLGWQGNTGNSTGPHLHYGVQLNGKYVNPEWFMAQRGVPLDGKAGGAATVGTPVTATPGCTPTAAVAGDVGKGFVETLKSYTWADWAPDGRLTPTPGYATAVQRAMGSGRFYGKQNDETPGRPPGIHCSAFISLLLTDSGFDPTFNYGGKLADGAGFVDTQKTWMEQNWTRLGKGSELSLSDLRPGDVGISNGGGFYHAWIYIGKVDGINGNFAEASYKYADSPGFAPQARQSSGVLYANKPDTTYYRKKATPA